MTSTPNKNNPEAFDDLTAQETRDIVTPYAFEVSQDLLGQKLATPMRRLIAQGIDLLFVVLLSSSSPLILGLFVGITFWKAGSNLAGKPGRYRTTRLLRLSAAIILFAMTYGLVNVYNHNEVPEVQSDRTEVSIKQAISAMVLWQCEKDLNCLQRKSQSFGENMGETSMTRQDLVEEVYGILSDLDIDESDKAGIEAAALTAFDAYRASQPQNETAQETTQDEALEGEDEAQSADNQTVESKAPSEEKAPYLPKAMDFDLDDKPEPGILSWINAIISDLGLGFGWAALYYSVFTAWWKGHTPGKRIMRIKVLKLDGTSTNLWESFGRYGGYGAGIATGLLGFLQVFWDPNRQAIQDKIAETLVIDERDISFKPSLDRRRSSLTTSANQAKNDNSSLESTANGKRDEEQTA